MTVKVRKGSSRVEVLIVLKMDLTDYISIEDGDLMETLNSVQIPYLSNEPDRIQILKYWEV